VLNVLKYTSDLSSDVLCFLFLSFFFFYVCIDYNSDNNNNNNNNNNNKGCMRNTKEGHIPFSRSLKSRVQKDIVCSRKHLIFV